MAAALQCRLHVMKLLGGSAICKTGRVKRNGAVSAAVTPSIASSANVLPNRLANLKVCAAPAATPITRSAAWVAHSQMIVPFASSRKARDVR